MIMPVVDRIVLIPIVRRNAMQTMRRNDDGNNDNAGVTGECF